MERDRKTGSHNKVVTVNDVAYLSTEIIRPLQL